MITLNKEMQTEENYTKLACVIPADSYTFSIALSGKEDELRLTSVFPTTIHVNKFRHADNRHLFIIDDEWCCENRMNKIGGKYSHFSIKDIMVRYHKYFNSHLVVWTFTVNCTDNYSKRCTTLSPNNACINAQQEKNSAYNFDSSVQITNVKNIHNVNIFHLLLL